MTISVHEAQIRTASVEIKTLSVSGKQVTLALFRQLLREPLYDDETMTVNGIPWGTINYHPDKCGDEGPHHHVVWQKGLELRRAHVPDPSPTPEWTSTRASAWLDAHIVEGWRPEPDQEYSLRHSSFWPLKVSVPGWPEPVKIYPSADARCVLKGHATWEERQALDRLNQKARAAAELQELVLDDLEDQQRRWQWRKECWAALNLLPQLFIAV